MLQPFDRGRDFRVDLIEPNQTGIGHECGQLTKLMSIERPIEDELQTAFDEVAQRADPFVVDDVEQVFNLLEPW